MALIADDGRLTGTMRLDALAPPDLTERDVHVWFAHLSDGDPDVTMAFEPLLDEQETGRAARFVFEHHRHRFIRSHGILRRVLAPYAGQEASALRFVQGHHGKPVLVGAGNLQFSLSHSANATAIAVTRGRDVGIDIEAQRHLNDRDDLVRRYFSALENAAFAATEPALRDRTFFRLWTRKEAFVKGIGLGLSRVLDSFTVNADIPARVEAPDDAEWSLHHLEPGDGFIGAVACRHVTPSLHGWTLVV